MQQELLVKAVLVAVVEELSIDLMLGTTALLLANSLFIDCR
jgi:hypothetical protein